MADRRAEVSKAAPARRGFAASTWYHGSYPQLREEGSEAGLPMEVQLRGLIVFRVLRLAPFADGAENAEGRLDFLPCFEVEWLVQSRLRTMLTCGCP